MDVAKRNSSLDIIRIVAMLSVISIHFFAYIGFYVEPMLGKEMLILTVVRSTFTVCVPLFIVLSGHLLNKKTFSGGYYYGIVKTLVIYVFAALGCMLYKALAHGTDYTFKTILFGIFDFSGAEYSWYIEMYIGLFLLIPFLNLIYNGLEGRRAKQALIVTLIVLTSLPSVLNVYNFEVSGWFKTPYLSTSYQQIIPDWWTSIYPITYYFLGAYLKEYPVKIKRIPGILLFVLTVVGFGVFNYYRSRGGYYSWGAYQDWGGLPVLIQTFLLFALLLSCDFSETPIWIKWLLAHISDLCLGAYLVSYIFDDWFYKILNDRVGTVTERALCFVPLVLSVAVASLISSGILNVLYWLLRKSLLGIISSVRQKHNRTV